MIVETFAVEKQHGEHDEENEVLERTWPIAPAIMATFPSQHHHWAFVLGAGEEFAKEGNLFLVRATEYTVHLSGAWETSGSATYDFRFDAYDSVMLAFGVTRVF